MYIYIHIFPSGFDVIIAADVIYEEEQVLPLIETVVKILKGDIYTMFIYMYMHFYIYQCVYMYIYIYIDRGEDTKR
jgi:hypothetical protein